MKAAKIYGLYFAAGALSYWVPDVLLRVVLGGLPPRLLFALLTFLPPACAVAAWLCLRRRLPVQARAGAFAMLAGLWLLGPILIPVGMGYLPGPENLRKLFEDLPLYGYFGLTFLMSTYSGSLGGVALGILALLVCVCVGRRGLALACALLIALPPSSWGAFKSVAAPIHGAPVVGVSVPTLPSISLPSTGLPATATRLETSFLPRVGVPSAVPAVLAQAVVPVGQVPVASVPNAVTPLPLAERLALPMGDWAKPDAQGGKQEAAADFERRAFGTPDQPSPAPTEPSGPGGGSDGGQNNLPPSGKRNGPHAVIMVMVSDAPGAREAAVSKFEKDYGFRLDYGFEPVQNGVTATVRGAVPLRDLPRLAQDPLALGIGPAMGRIESLSFQPYKTPEKRENAFRWGLRSLLEKAEPLGILAMAPFALGTMLVFGPLVAAAYAPAPVSWLVGVGGGLVLASVTALQVFLQKVPPVVRFSLGPLAQAAGGVWLATHGLPVLGAWAALNSILAAAAAARVLLPMKGRAMSHPRERTIQSAELSALITGVASGLTALGAAAAHWPSAPYFAAFAAATLALLVLPGLKPKAAPAAAPSAAPADPELEYGRALKAALAAEKRRGRYIYGAAAAMVFAPLTLAGGMKAMLWGWIALPGLTVLATSLVGVCLWLIVGGVSATIGVAKANGRLQRAAAAVNRAAGARTAEDVRRALGDAAAKFAALDALETLRPRLSPLVAALKRDEAKLDERERAAVASLERALAGTPSATLAAEGRLAADARRRLLWDDASLAPQAAGAEDSSLEALSRDFARQAGQPEDADKEFTFLADRLDKLYAAPGALDPRHVALALSAATGFRFAEYQRRRGIAARNMMTLEALLKRQARNPNTDPEKRKAQAKALLENVLAGFAGDEY